MFHKCLLLIFLAFSGPLPAAPAASARYETTQPRPGGIGKWYMGREIAAVMGHTGVNWLERGERDAEEKPRLIVENMELKPTDVVADIGAGSGVLTFLIAPKVPKGKTYAVDIQPEMLRLIEKKQRRFKLANITAVLGTPSNPRLPRDSLDAALFVDSYHEFSHPIEMMTATVASLKKGGKVFLVEFRGEDQALPIKPHHKMTEEQAKKEMASFGLRWRETRGNLPRQHFMVFEKP